MTEDPAIRRRTMQAVKSKDTAPELVVRRLAHRMGYRFRLHRRDLPGKPDLAFPKLHKALFVHGCFWHGHNCARGARVPVQNRDYWIVKIARNKERDLRAGAALEAIGWSSLVLWECQLKDADTARNIIRRFLEGDRGGGPASHASARPAKAGGLGLDTQ